MEVRRLVGAAAVLTSAAALAAAFALPYHRANGASRPPVAALLGRLDGAARLTRITEPDGTTTWLSTTTVSLPATVVGGLPKAIGEAVGDRLGRRGKEAFEQEGQLVGASVLRDQVVERRSGQAVTVRSAISMLDDRGIALVASIDEDGTTNAYDPPLQILPRDPRPGSTWTSSGRAGSGARYRYTAEVIRQRRRDPGVGGPVRCIRVRSELRITNGGSSSEQRSSEWWCEGLGSASYVVDAPQFHQTARLVGIDGRRGGARPPTGGAAEPAAPPHLGEEPWTRTGVAASLSGAVTARPSMLPVVVEADGGGGVVVATEASPALQELRIDPGERSVRGWSAAMGAVAYGSPLLDRTGGRLFAGSAEGSVRAFTADGLFLWSTDVGANVAVRPALVDGVLVVGSDDGRVTGLDPADGRVRWRVRTHGPVASWPAAVGRSVVIGSDDGIVRSIDVRDGAVRWTYDLGAPIEAPVGVLGHDVVVQGRDGTVARLGPDGRPRWSASTGLTLRTGAVLDHGHLLTVGGGTLIALDASDGSVAWRHDRGYVGPVAPIAGRASVVAATAAGELLALDRRGRVVERWKDLADVGGFGASPGITVGPVAGAGAVWVIDGSGRVQRLGPATAGAAEERAPSWAVSAGAPPLSGSLLQASPLVDGDATYLLGVDGQVLGLDERAGTVEQTGEIDLQGSSIKLSAVARDGVGFVAAQRAVAAFSLPDGRVRWRADLPGSAVRSPVLAGQVLLVASEDDETHHVTAFDTRTGKVRWTRATGTAAVPGAMFGPLVVAGDVVVTGDPARAIDVSDGTTRWTSTVAGILGSATVLPSGEVVLALTDALDPTDDIRSSLVALDPADGSVVHRVDLPGLLPEGFVDLVRVGSDVVLADAGRSRLVRVDPLHGEGPAWSAVLPAGRLGGTALLDDGLLWLALVDGRVAALDPATGRVVVRTSELGLDLSGGGLAQVPVQIGDTVVVTAGLLALGVPAGAP